MSEPASYRHRRCVRIGIDVCVRIGIDVCVRIGIDVCIRIGIGIDVCVRIGIDVASASESASASALHHVSVCIRVAVGKEAVEVQCDQAGMWLEFLVPRHQQLVSLKSETGPC